MRLGPVVPPLQAPGLGSSQWPPFGGATRAVLTVLCQCGLGHAADTRPGSAPQPAQPRSSRPGPASPIHSKSKTRSRTSLRPAGPPARRLAQPTAAAVAAHRSDLGPVEKGYEGDGRLPPAAGLVAPGPGRQTGPRLPARAGRRRRRARSRATRRDGVGAWRRAGAARSPLSSYLSI